MNNTTLENKTKKEVYNRGGGGSTDRGDLGSLL